MLFDAKKEGFFPQLSFSESMTKTLTKAKFSVTRFLSPAGECAFKIPPGHEHAEV